MAIVLFRFFFNFGIFRTVGTPWEFSGLSVNCWWSSVSGYSIGSHKQPSECPFAVAVLHRQQKRMDTSTLAPRLQTCPQRKCICALVSRCRPVDLICIRDPPVRAATVRYRQKGNHSNRRTANPAPPPPSTLSVQAPLVCRSTSLTLVVRDGGSRG